MVGTYDIVLDEKIVGQVQVEGQGLYYHFRCRCDPGNDGVYRVMVRCGDDEENLGICVPVDGQFGLDKRIPRKRLGEGKPSFFLLPKYNQVAGRFVSVFPEEPFSYIHRLEGAFLARQGEQLGIVIPE